MLRKHEYPNLDPGAVHVHDASRRRGPTSRDWDEHRAELTSLYLDDRLKLDEVIDYMINTHNFHASPRQYQERFRQWRVRKNITRTVREEMTEKQAHGTLNIHPDEQRRLERQAKTHPERMLTSSTTQSSGDQMLVTTPTSTTVSHSGASLREVGSIMESVYDDMGSFQAIGSPPTPTVPLTTDNGIVQPWRRDFALSNSPPRATLQAQSSSLQGEGDLVSTRLSISPSPPLMPTASNNAEMIFFSLRQFCEHFTSQPTLSPTDEETNSSMSSSLVQKRTNDLKDIIYLYKIGNFARADGFLQTYCELPFESVVDQSVDFLRQIITTLAPINTTRRPEVRRQLLEHLYRITRTNLGPWHPFTIICKHLRFDQNSLEISMRALRVLRNSVMVWSRLMSFRTELDLIQMMRREQDLDGATRKARLLIDSSTLIFGIGSTQVRKTKLELTCIHIAQQDYASAMSVCHQIHDQHTDMLAVRAAENLAEVYRLQFDLESSAIWLERAFDLMLRNEDSPVATVHILDKLSETLTSIGGIASLDKIRRCNERYAQHL